MSILEKMRGSTDSTPMQVVLVLIVVAFIGWYALPQGEKIQVALEVDGERVLQQEFGQRYYIQEQLAGGRLDDAAAAALANEVKQDIARELVVEQEARRQGYHISAREMTRRIKADPRYLDTSGSFDPDLWRGAIKDSGRSKGDVENDYRDALLRDKLREAVTLGVTLPDALVDAEYDERFRTLDLEVVRLDPRATEGVTEDPEAVAAWAEANRAAIQADYDGDLATRYELPERLELRVIRLQATDGDREALTERLEGLRAELSAGAPFAALARRWSEDPSAALGGALGERRVNTLTTTVRDALEDVPEGQLSTVVDEGDVLSLYRVDTRKPARTVPLDEVFDTIAARLYRDMWARTWADEVAEGWRTGALPQERLDEVGARVETLPPVMPSQYQEGPGMPPADLVEQAASADAGTVLPPMARDTDRGQVWFVARVAARNAADPEFKEAFRVRRLMERRDAVWTAYVDSLLAEADVNLGGGQATQGGLFDEVLEFLDSVTQGG